jgi:hypothetical protein
MRHTLLQRERGDEQAREGRLADHPGEENAGVFRNRHGTAINSPDRESLDQSGKEKSERKNQRETVTRTAEVHQGVGDKREAEKAADDFQIAEEYETGGKITLS